jgi:hypothetical protein
MAIRSRPGAASRNTSMTDKAKLPWAGMFRDYGLSITDMPSDQPPQPHAGYGAILDWVTGTAWEMEEHSSLAIDIWLRRVDPLNYQSRRKAEGKPAATGSQETPASSGPALRRRASPAQTSPEKAEAPTPAPSAGPGLRSRSRLGSRRSAADPAPGPKP